MTNKTYIPIIGLEVHIELATKSKMFCGCGADWFGREPNTLTCPVCLGLPGALPVPNKKAVEWTIMLGLALNCQIALESKFDRKNYFYPDLPKGYQISQYNQPLASKGWLKSEILNPKSKTNSKSQIQNSKRIRIRRVHLEEDTGKLIHTELTPGDSLPQLTSGDLLRKTPDVSALGVERVTLVDFNRSGVPLVEIVTEPDIRSSEEADLFLKKLRQIVRYLGISDADMEKGSMRIEPNVSILVRDSTPSDSLPDAPSVSGTGRKTLGVSFSDEANRDDLPNYKVEIKNINSFKFAKSAIEYEIKRQTDLIKQGKTPIQETRGWDEKRRKTVSQRRKEEAHDYRYFSEPDIPPMRFAHIDLSRLKKALPELPDAKADRFIKEYSLSSYYSKILTRGKNIADYFESSVKLGKKQDVKITTIANWIVNKKPDPVKISPKELIAKIVFETKRETQPKGKLQTLVKNVLKKNKRAIEDYKRGKKEAIGFLIGEVMREAKGKIDAKEVKELLEEQVKTVDH